VTPLIGLLVEVAEGALGTCGGGHGCPLFVSTGESRASGGDRERVTSLIATFATATTSVSSVSSLNFGAVHLICSVDAVKAFR
jgi:hypothetical protein